MDGFGRAVLSRLGFHRYYNFSVYNGALRLNLYNDNEVCVKSLIYISLYFSWRSSNDSRSVSLYKTTNCLMLIDVRSM